MIEQSSAFVLNINEIVDQWIDPILWVVTSRSGQQRGGLIATFVSRASLVPCLPRFVVGIAKHHFTWKLIQESQTMGLHVVGQEHWCWLQEFGLQSTHDGVDKFSGIAAEVLQTGAPILKQAPLWMDCRVESSLDIGDRTIFLVNVVSAGVGSDSSPARLLESMRCLSDEQQSECRRRLEYDIQIDSAAILNWRVNH